MKKLFLSLAVVMSVSMFSCNGGAGNEDSIKAADSAKAADSIAALATAAVENAVNPEEGEAANNEGQDVVEGAVETVEVETPATQN